jgi:tetratricopeptide (TPR) repeat protein
MVSTADNDQRVTQLTLNELANELPPNELPMHDGSDSASTLPVSPFTTTSDVLKELNRALAVLDPNDEGSDGGKTSDVKPRFEIQKKFDSGATRPATEAEVKSQDFQAKLKQTAQHLSTLSSDEDRDEFIQKQISYGNQLYDSRQYEEAMDVYLTCLVGIETSSRPSQNVVLLYRILHNLAQSALQLGWYAKCIRFCSIGLQHLQLEESGIVNSTTICNLGADSMSTSAVGAGRRQYAAMLYFKRAKAQRLKGNYTDAQHDLKQAEAWIEGSAGSTPRAQQQNAIRKEQRLLHQAIQRGRENHRRQQSAMQQVLNNCSRERPQDSQSSGSNEDNPVSFSSTGIDHAGGRSSLYMDRIDAREAGKRKYSTLRAPSYYAKDDMKDEETSEEAEVLGLSCCQKVVRLLVSWLTNDNGDDKKLSALANAGKVD